MKRKLLCLFALFMFCLLVFCACGENAKTADNMSKSGASFGTEAAVDPGTTDPGSTMPPKIIRTADVEAETKSYDDAMASIKTKIGAVGGYISDARTHGAGEEYGRTAYLTVRVPAEKLDEFLAYVEDNVHVTDATVSSNDVSSRYYDIEARLVTLRAEKDALDDMLAHAATTAEALAIRAQLTDVTQSIESYETQIRLYDDRISYSTVTIHLTEVVVFSPASERFGARVSNAFSESWRAFRTFFANVFLFFVYALPFILLLLIILAVALTIVLVRRKKKDAAKQEKEKESE